MADERSGAPRHGRFVQGVIAGVLLVGAAGWFINETAVADWIVAPLLVADTTEPVDAIVVLGAGVIGNCVPNQHGMRRVLLAVRRWRQQPSALMLFSGGTGGPCPVAEAMAGLARELGVPERRVLVERVSTNTRENAVLTTALLRAWGMPRVMVVTDRLHMRRAAASFRRLGLETQRASVPIYEGHEDNVSMLRAGLREFAALGYYRMRGWSGAAADLSRAADTTMPTKPTTISGGPIVLLGASYAASWPLTQVAGVPVVNKGVAGQQSFELLARFDADVVQQMPRAVILWGFINDLFRAQGDTDAVVARVKDSYLQMIAQARAAGIVPVLATEVTTRPTARGMADRLMNTLATLLGRQAYQDRINQQVLAINEWMFDTGRRQGLLVLPLQQITAEPGGRRLPAFAQADGSHITPAGYDHLTSYARPVLEEFLVVR
jgi:uncharacterized SAM-binding protein YcdF (DUF218 family)/lysophospholipase L1-like esterase